MSKSTDHQEVQDAGSDPGRGRVNAAATQAATTWPRIGAERTLAQEVYEAVRARLLESEPPPGTFIRESELTEAMGVSRTPVREALGRLASEGFVERIPQRGFRVPEQSLDDLFHLYPILTALEALAGELALKKLKAAELDEMERINRRFADALKANDVVEAVEQNDRFHRFLSERSGNPLLQGRLDDLRMQIRRLEIWDFSEVLREASSAACEAWVRQHAAIIQAARDEAYEEAATLLRENRTLVYLTAHRHHQQAEQEVTTGTPEEQA